VNLIPLCLKGPFSLIIELFLKTIVKTPSLLINLILNY
jgi:hypothetical protein